MRLFLSGPMGSGKSTVGRLLATSTGRPFVDLDERVATAAGRTIAAIFQEEGEAGFRERERNAVFEVLRNAPDNGVVALGGGTVLDAAVRKAVLAAGTLITLDARPEVLAERLRGDRSRPLLHGEASNVDRLRALSSSRRRAYAMSHATVDTSELSIGQVVTEVERMALAPPLLLAMGEHVTRVHLENGGASALRNTIGRCSAVLVADEQVARSFGEQVARGLPNLLGTVLLSSGEPVKSFASYESLLGQIGALNLGRDGCLVSLGGGAVGDVVGFAAATYQRGVRWTNVPTTLLAMFDSCIGGKTGVDTERGKNQVGAFHPASDVIVDVSLLATLPVAQRRYALAELIKAAILDGEESLHFVEASCDALIRGDLDVTEEAIRLALRVKSRIVSSDPWEEGERRLLNLGHTFGHAVEAAAGYGAIAHGEAVAYGLRAALRFGESLGETDSAFATRVNGLLTQAGLAVTPQKQVWVDASRLLDSDKKRQGEELTFVLPRGPGDVVFWPVKVARLAEFAANLAASAGES